MQCFPRSRQAFSGKTSFTGLSGRLAERCYSYSKTVQIMGTPKSNRSGMGASQAYCRDMSAVMMGKALKLPTVAALGFAL